MPRLTPDVARRAVDVAIIRSIALGNGLVKNPKGVPSWLYSTGLNESLTVALTPESMNIQKDDAAFSPGDTHVTPAGFVFDDTSPDSVREDGVGAARMSANRNQYMQIRDGAGNERAAYVDASGNLSITGAVAVVGGVADDTATSGFGLPVMGYFTTDEVDSEDLGILSMNAKRHLFTAVQSVIPGTAATNLGKAIDSVVGSTDTGVAMLAKHNSDTTHLTTAEGDYDVCTLSNFGALNTEPEQHHIIDEMDVTTDWSVLGDDTTNLVLSTNHVLGTKALSFDKANGTDNTIFAGIQKTLSSLDLGVPSPHDLLQTVIYLSDISNVEYVFIRLGTDSTNYNEWRIGVDNLSAGEYEILAFALGDPSFAGNTGNGIDWGAITYVTVGVAFDLQSRTLSGIIFDEISFHTNQHVSAQINTEISSSINSANINLNKVANKVTNTGAGNASTGTQRVSISTDDINLAAIKTAVEATTIVKGSVAHSGADVDAPIKIGAKAVELDTTTSVSDDDVTDLKTTRSGLLLGINGSPNTKSATLSKSTTALADIISATAGNRIVLTKISIYADGANSADVGVNVAFDNGDTILVHGSIKAGSGLVEGNGAGILGIGDINEGLECTLTTTEQVDFNVSYFLEPSS